ncbi:hypothetical protein JCM10908_002734 [Rhodotorula pacifica]|uniref:Vac14p n=1 Tax=Rhodotorula pacifica TaxID=1495444 RepID=UPI003174D6C9
MEQAVRNGLQNKDYDVRKKTALAFEPFLRELAATRTQDSEQKLRTIITQLVELAGTRLQSSSATTTVRSGGIMGLASLAIALGPRLAEYLGPIVMPVLACFEDHDSKLRYYACESMYNITKVAHGEILVYFNELFDALSKLTADSDPSVKNGAELLDRLLKDIVTEQAATYISLANYGDDAYPGTEKENGHLEPVPSTSRSVGGSAAATAHQFEPPRAFSLPRFMPLLYERITVLNPWTRTFLISWLVVLNQVPDLELVSYLPEFLEGLLTYLGDPTYEVRTQTEILLEVLLREIGAVREVQLELMRNKREAWEGEMDRRRRRASEAKTVTVTDRDEEEVDESTGKETPTAQRTLEAARGLGAADAVVEDDEEDGEGEVPEADENDAGEWTPGQGVKVDYPAIVEILIRFVSAPDEEVQATCLHWIGEFLQIVPGVLIPFAPRLIPVILSALAHHVPEIQQAAVDTNEQLFSVVQSLPVDGQPSQNGMPLSAELSPTGPSNVSLPPTTGNNDRVSPITPSSIPFPTSLAGTPRPGHDRSKPGSDAASLLHAGQAAPLTLASLSLAPTSPASTRGLAYPADLQDEYEPDGRKFQYGATVNELTLQFLSDNEETRVAALEWLLMLHQKAPRKILAGDNPSLLGRKDRSQSGRQRNPSSSSTSSGLSLAVLLKLLSDSSERVLRFDLQLLTQISSLGDGSGGSSGEDYFAGLMTSLLELFSTDRKLLETRGSLIIRQLCGTLNAERIYRTCAEILETDEDLEFASIMVQNLNLIMITSPELSDFRKRLRTLESKDGQNLFVTLYRSWSHNAVSTFTLCLLAQAYEQASALLQIFAELEMTVPMLIQIDKLVQLIESPVFTSLRLQLLEPERYPYLLKAMYGLLMLLPQSSAFATLRNRLSAVSSLGFLQTVPRSNLTAPTAVRGSSYGGTPGSVGAGSSLAARVSRPEGATPDPPSVRWHELLAHFRQVQKRRANIMSAASGGRSTGGTDMSSTGGRGASRTRDGTMSVDGVSPPTSSGFGHGQARPAKRRPAVATELNQATLSSVTAGRPTAGGDGASMASSRVTGGSGGRGTSRAGPVSQAGAHRALSPTLQTMPKSRAPLVPTSKDSGRQAATGTGRRT